MSSTEERRARRLALDDRTRPKAADSTAADPTGRKQRLNIHVLRGLEVASDEAALRRLGGEAIAHGWAREGYVEALLQREQEYPTGIATATARVALVHADPQWVVQPGLLVAVLAAPVPFRSMEDPSQTIDVDTIFLMLIDRPGAHLTMLKQLVGLVQDPRFPLWRPDLTAWRLEELLAGKDAP